MRGVGKPRVKGIMRGLTKNERRETSNKGLRRSHPYASREEKSRKTTFSQGKDRGKI